MKEYTVKQYDDRTEWYLDGKLHREDGPAVEYADGNKCWYLNGKLHREDGPAIEYANGTKSWYLNDQRYSEEEFRDRMSPASTTEWVLVECISQFRMRYMVEVTIGKSEWALDTVTMNEAQEFSQEHLGETIISHRLVSQKEALELCDRDNDYCKSWSDEDKIKTFFNKMGNDHE